MLPHVKCNACTCKRANNRLFEDDEWGGPPDQTDVENYCLAIAEKPPHVIMADPEHDDGGDPHARLEEATVDGAVCP